MSETPRRCWIDKHGRAYLEPDDDPDAEQLPMFVSAEALWDLCEKWRVDSHSGESRCADHLEALLDDR